MELLLREYGSTLLLGLAAALAAVWMRRRLERQRQRLRQHYPESHRERDGTRSHEGSGQTPGRSISGLAWSGAGGRRDDPRAEHPDYLRWQVELHEVSQQTKAELDTKMRALQVLMGQADEATCRLQLAIQRAERLGLAPRMADSLGPEWAGPEGAGPEGPGPEGAGIERVTRAAQAQIYQLADQDHSTIEIARATGLPLGDVELLLSLRH